MIKYSYPKQTITTSNNINLNMSSYINPRKKMIMSNKNKVISQNFNDESETRYGIFNVVPTTEPFSFIEGYEDYSVMSEIDILNNMLTSSVGFDDIISHIEKIIKLISENNAQDEYAHIVNIYKNDLTNIKYCFSVAKSLYTNISNLHTNITENYLKIGLNNVYGNLGSSGNMTFDINLANIVVGQLTKLENELKATKQKFKNNYNLSIIEVDSEIIFFNKYI